MRHLQTLRMIEDVARAGSIRRAAEAMHLTASALNRRIQNFEAEFGAPIFERLPRGVRLNPAGELLLHHIRTQRADLARVRSQVADLSGERRGVVTIACSQGLLPYFLPREIAAYRAEHPGVGFRVLVRDRAAAERELSAFAADLAVVYEPAFMADFEIVASARQPVQAIMAPDHPLAARPDLRLRECLDWPHAVPETETGVRHLLDLALRGSSRRLAPAVVSDSFEFLRHYVLHERLVSFQIPVGLTEAQRAGLIARPLPARDVPPGHLILGHQRGRTLPVAAARFADRLAATLAAMAADETPSASR
ncbi:MAG: LysR family transcriptional regulator [Rhodobacteraceae bacterium]|nr:MAG: LysR family transcriptional regulator [Paracoccaceae bacterium]